MATRRRVSRKNIVNTISDTERRLAYVEKLPTKTTLADGSVTTAKIANSSITQQKVVFGTVNPIADIPGAGSVTEQATKSVYIDSDTGEAAVVDSAGNQTFIADLTAQDNAADALTSANGKNKVFHQGTEPTNASLPSGVTLATGDVWFDSSAGFRMRKYNTSTGWSNYELGYAAISSLDAGVITTGTLSGRSFTLDGGESIIVRGAINKKKITSNLVILEVVLLSGDTQNVFTNLAGTSITVFGLGAPYDGEHVISYAVDDAIAYTIYGTNADVDPKINAYVEIIQKQIVSEVATLTTNTAHNFQVGDLVSIASVGSPFSSSSTISATTNKTSYSVFTITAVTSGGGNNTFSYKIPGASAVASTPVSPFGKAYGIIENKSYPSSYNMVISPSLDIAMYPIQDGNLVDKLLSPGMSISQTFAGGFAGLTDVDEAHAIVGAYSSGSTSSAVFGSVFGISTTATEYESLGAIGAGMNVSINGASTGSFNASPARAPAIVELYGDIVKLRHIGDYLTAGGPNIAHSGTDLADYRTVLRYSSGVAQGTGGIQPGTIAWTTSAVTGVTLTGGVAGDLVFKYTV